MRQLGMTLKAPPAARGCQVQNVMTKKWQYLYLTHITYRTCVHFHYIHCSSVLRVLISGANYSVGTRDEKLAKDKQSQSTYDIRAVRCSYNMKPCLLFLLSAIMSVYTSCARAAVTHCISFKIAGDGTDYRGSTIHDVVQYYTDLGL